MRHITRNNKLPLPQLQWLRCAIALCAVLLTIFLTLKLPAYAQTALPEKTDASGEAAASLHTSNHTSTETLLGEGGILAGEQGSNLESTDLDDSRVTADAEDTPEETPEPPSGEVWQVLKGNAIIYIYLPGLPLAWFENAEAAQPPLQTLLIERASNPSSPEWVSAKELSWNEEYESYTTADYDTLPHEPYLINYGDDYALLSFTETNTKYRDFSLRITATVLLDGVLETVCYDPIFIHFPDEMKPPGFDDNEGNTNPGGQENEDDATEGDNSDWNAGSIDGNRGGVGQGESTRIDPGSSAAQLIQKSERAYAETQGEQAPKKNPEAAADGDAFKNEAAGTTSSSAKGDTSSGAPGASAPNSSDAPAHIPGFMWVIGISVIIIATGITIVEIRRRRA